MVSALFVVDLVWMSVSRLQFDWASLTLGVSVPVILLLAAWFYTFHRPSERIANLSVDAAILILFSHLGCIFSYLVSAHGGDLQDELMVAVDQSLGFDWHSYTQFFLRNDLLRLASILFYSLTLVLVVATVVWLSFAGHTGRSREFVSTIILGAILCIGISGLVPTAGGAGYFAPDSAFYLGHMVIVDRDYMQDFFDLRSGVNVIVSLVEPKGLISFPSYHACMAVLVILAFRRMGFMFWLMLAVNVGVIATTPVEGGHHLSDVLGGIALGLVAFVLIRRFTGVAFPARPGLTDSR
jgi:membrane-associated phospholipid phosphatase